MTREIDEITGESIDAAYKLHTGLGPGLLESAVIVELRSVEKLAPVHWNPVLTYLRLLNLPVGLPVNFGGVTLEKGLHRIVNGYVPSCSASPRLRVNLIERLWKFIKRRALFGRYHPTLADDLRPGIRRARASLALPA
jgi:hypothetical protein